MSAVCGPHSGRTVHTMVVSVIARDLPKGDVTTLAYLVNEGRGKKMGDIIYGQLNTQLTT